jgi:hypothetical protein
MRSFSLPEFALAVRQRADLGGQQNAFGSNTSGEITDAELQSMIQIAITKVWGILCRKFPDNYAWGDGGTGTGQGYIIPVAQGTYRYLLPYDFYKEKGVDLALDSTLQNWASVRPYSLRDRNLFSFPLQTVLAYAGWQNMRFMIQGNYLNFLPQLGPLPGNMRLLYFPQAPTLVLQLPSSYPGTTTPVALGTLIQVTNNGGNQVFQAVIAGTTGNAQPTWSQYFATQGGLGIPGVVQDGSVYWAYKGPLSSYVTVFDGISGYEDAVILIAAVMARTKQEGDAGDLSAQLAAEMERIEAEAANRQSGDPRVIAGGFGSCEGGPAYGNGFGPFGGW